MILLLHEASPVVSPTARAQTFQEVAGGSALPLALSYRPPSASWKVVGGMRICSNDFLPGVGSEDG